MSHELDRKRIEALTADLMVAMRQNYLRGPTNSERVLEALNALAACVAVLITASSGKNGKAHQFFLYALKLSLDDLSLKREGGMPN